MDMISDPTPAPPLQGRGVPAESRAAGKAHPQPVPSGREVPAESHAAGKAVAAPLPCRGGAGVGSLTSICYNLFGKGSSFVANGQNHTKQLWFFN